MSKIWLVTGISGSGRIELLNELSTYAKEKGKTVSIYDVGAYIADKAVENGIAFKYDKILNIDKEMLSLLRSLAIQDIKGRIAAEPSTDIIFIGMHAVFQWKRNLIPGVSYSDLMSIQINGVINVVDDIIKIYETNKKNPKWSNESLPAVADMQRWMMEEELLSSIFASIKKVPVYVHCRQQSIENLYSFFFSEKKRIYLSYPITAIRNEPILNTIQTDYLKKIQELFYVFNPLDIKDKTHLSEKNLLLNDSENAALIDSRTVSRDYRFISQSDAVVVLYPTEKLSPGVAAEMNYAHSHQIPVYMFFSGNESPFLTDVANVYKDENSFFSELKKFAES